eukprot:TRINITY_DN817_c0_g1_i1.p2 TRINITY_DN817_c0_g1~~TRINITY_DN817_c0_g1_i1.p2  ORF type:complete len:126 (-),score=12.98 TRINITY_DN817_c0_g1_i1:86-463(-)
MFLSLGGLTHTVVAVKELKINSDSDMATKKRRQLEIEREVEIMSRIRGCKNILPLQEVLDYNNSDRLCLVYPFVRGGNLKDFIANGRVTSEGAVKGIISGVLGALLWLHGSREPPPPGRRSSTAT